MFSRYIKRSIQIHYCCNAVNHSIQLTDTSVNKRILKSGRERIWLGEWRSAEAINNKISTYDNYCNDKVLSFTTYPLPSGQLRQKVLLQNLYQCPDFMVKIHIQWFIFYCSTRCRVIVKAGWVFGNFIFYH